MLLNYLCCHREYEYIICKNCHGKICMPCLLSKFPEDAPVLCSQVWSMQGRSYPMNIGVAQVCRKVGGDAKP